MPELIDGSAKVVEDLSPLSDMPELHTTSSLARGRVTISPEPLFKTRRLMEIKTSSIQAFIQMIARLDELFSLLTGRAADRVTIATLGREEPDPLRATNAGSVTPEKIG